MTLWHIKDFEDLPHPLPWTIIGVLPTQQDYLTHGEAIYNDNTCFCYTVSHGPLEVWCPMLSVERRFCPPEVLADVINTIFTAVTANQLVEGDNIVVPFEYTEPIVTGSTHGDGVFWIGSPTEDASHTRFRCYQSRNQWVLPLRWSSPQGPIEE